MFVWHRDTAMFTRTHYTLHTQPEHLLPLSIISLATMKSLRGGIDIGRRTFEVEPDIFDRVSLHVRFSFLSLQAKGNFGWNSLKRKFHQFPSTRIGWRRIRSFERGRTRLWLIKVAAYGWPDDPAASGFSDSALTPTPLGFNVIVMPTVTWNEHHWPGILIRFLSK